MADARLTASVTVDVSADEDFELTLEVIELPSPSDLLTETSQCPDNSVEVSDQAVIRFGNLEPSWPPDLFGTGSTGTSVLLDTSTTPALDQFLAAEGLSLPSTDLPAEAAATDPVFLCMLDALVWGLRDVRLYPAVTPDKVVTSEGTITYNGFGSDTKQDVIEMGGEREVALDAAYTEVLSVLAYRFFDAYGADVDEAPTFVPRGRSLYATFTRPVYGYFVFEGKREFLSMRLAVTSDGNDKRVYIGAFYQGKVASTLVDFTVEKCEHDDTISLGGTCVGGSSLNAQAVWPNMPVSNCTSVDWAKAVGTLSTKEIPKGGKVDWSVPVASRTFFTDFDAAFGIAGVLSVQGPETHNQDISINVGTTNSGTLPTVATPGVYVVTWYGCQQSIAFGSFLVTEKEEDEEEEEDCPEEPEVSSTAVEGAETSGWEGTGTEAVTSCKDMGAVWTEVNRLTETFEVDGVEIERMTRVTFSRTSGGETSRMTLVFNNEDSEE